MINPKKIWEISKKDLIRILKGKSFLYVLLAQFLVISLTITSFTQFPQIFSNAKIPSNILKVGFLGDYEFYLSLEEAMNITLYPYSNLSDAIHGYKIGYIDAIIFCRNCSFQSFRNNSSEKPILVKVFSGEERNSKSSLLISRLKYVLEKKGEEIRIERIRKFKPEFKILSLKSISREEKIPSTIIYSLLLPLFFLSAVTLSGTLMINLFLIEIERKTIENLLSAPLSKLDLILSKSFTSVILAPTQIFLWVVMLNFSFPIQNSLLLLALAFFYSIIFTSLALVSSLIARTRDTAQNIYTIFLIPTFAFLLPIPVELIKNLGFFINLIPVFLITRLSFIAESSSEVLISFFITGFFSLGLFIFSFKLAEKHL